MKNIKKMTYAELSKKLQKAVIVQARTGKFLDLQCEIEEELTRRAHAAIYKTCCWALKNRSFPNQFAAAAHYADAVINGHEYFEGDESHEIGSYYTKSGNPVVVFFE